MFNRFIGSLRGFAQQKAAKASSLSMSVRSKAGAVAATAATTAHRTLTVLGIVAIVALGIMFVKPDVADHIKVLSPFSVAAVATEIETGPVTAGTPVQTKAMDASAKPFKDNAISDFTIVAIEDKKLAATQREQKLVTAWIARRYRVAKDAADLFVSAAYLTAMDTKLDPLLILSVMAIESRFNPYAESPVGAQGLMQVMSKIHHDKFQKLGGVKAALNPVTNIKVGSQILREYVKRGGSVEAGLKLYVGAAAFDTDFGYGSKVLAEYRRLKEVASGKSVPVFTTTITATKKPRQPEPVIETVVDPIEAEMAAPVTPNIATTEPGLIATL